MSIHNLNSNSHAMMSKKRVYENVMQTVIHQVNTEQNIEPKNRCKLTAFATLEGKGNGLIVSIFVLFKMTVTLHESLFAKLELSVFGQD